MCGHESHDQDEDGAVQAPPQSIDTFPWHHGVFDVHCHCGERTSSLDDLTKMNARAIVVLATRCQDQDLVSAMAMQHNIGPQDDSTGATKVIPGFGRHPWFSHEVYDDTSISSPGPALQDPEHFKETHYRSVLTPEPQDPAFWKDLPAPVALSTFISETRERLKKHPYALVGEIGLDKAFRLPQPWGPETTKPNDPERTPGGRQRRPLSQFRIKMAHQEAILKAYLKLAGEMNRPVSVHGVQVHGVLYNLLVESWKGYEKSKRRDRKALKGSMEDHLQGSNEKEADNTEKGRPFPPRICLHSFSGKAEAVQQYLKPNIPAKMFFSFSKTNNLRDESSRSKMESAVKAVPRHQLLVETDLHTAGERMDLELEETYRAISEFRGWELDDCVRTIADNFRSFIFGDDCD